MSAYMGAVRVVDKCGKPTRWVFTATTEERGLCWGIVLADSERDAVTHAHQRLRIDHEVNVLRVALASQEGI